MPMNKLPVAALKSTSPKHIIQVFQNWASFSKLQNNHEQRKKVTQWNDPLLSHSGYANGVTFLLDSFILGSQQQFESCDTIIISDFNSSEVAKYKQIFTGPSATYSLLQLKAGPAHYYIFNIARAEAIFALSLNYTDHASYIGKPSRADYKIAELKAERPIRVTINGKHDFSLSGRIERTFTEEDYFFVYVGEYSQFEFHTPDVLALHKSLPHSGIKHIDLKEILR